MKKLQRNVIRGCMFFAVALLPAAAQSNWHVLRTIPIGGDGGWDYTTVDAATHRIFVTRSTHTMVIDPASGKVLGDIQGQKRSHGVALVPRLNRGFITDGGGSGAIVVFDLKTYAVLGEIAAQPDADGIIYDAKSDRVIAVSGDGNALMMLRPDVDPKNGKLEATIDLGGSPEFLATDGTGKVYVNLANKDMVAVVDLASRKVIARWPTAPAGHPTGMSIDPAAHLLFIGCRNPQKMVVMNTETGKIEAELPIGAGVDADGFYKGEAFASCGDGTLTVAKAKNGSWQVEEMVKTVAGARTMGIDASNGRIYLPTAEMEPPATPGGRPRPKAGTFMMVEVGK